MSLFFSSAAQLNGQAILYFDEGEVLHPYLILKYKGYDELFVLPDNYVSRYKDLWEGKDPKKKI